MRRFSFIIWLGLSAVLIAGGKKRGQEDMPTVIGYNTPPQWADWASQLKAIQEDLGIHIPHDNKNSGQTLAVLLTEKENPIADFAYYGVTFAIKAKEQSLTRPYQGALLQKVPASLRDPDGHWVGLHSGTIGLMVNMDALEGMPVPRSWEDLLNPRYKGMMGFLDPTSSFVGYAAAVAINGSFGGTLEDFTAAIDFFKKLKKNNPIVPKQTAYSRVLSGEIPILFDYGFNAYRARYQDGGNIEFVIPQEGTISVPYVVSLVNKGPHPQLGEKIIDYLLSEKGQGIWANAYLRPVRPEVLSTDISSRFLPESEYRRSRAVDYQQMAAVQDSFTKRYLDEVR